jgi:hypothetical protein
MIDNKKKITKVKKSSGIKEIKNFNLDDILKKITSKEIKTPKIEDPIVNLFTPKIEDPIVNLFTPKKKTRKKFKTPEELERIEKMREQLQRQLEETRKRKAQKNVIKNKRHKVPPVEKATTTDR